MPRALKWSELTNSVKLNKGEVKICKLNNIRTRSKLKKKKNRKIKGVQK